GITSYESFFAGADGGENPGARQQMDALDARGSRQADAPGAQGSRQADTLDARGSRQTNAPGTRKNRRQAGGPRAAKRRADQSSIPGEGTASVPSGTELYNAGRRTDRDFTRSDGQAGVRSRAASGV